MWDTGLGFNLPNVRFAHEFCALREVVRQNPYLDMREVNRGRRAGETPRACRLTMRHVRTAPMARRAGGGAAS